MFIQLKSSCYFIGTPDLSCHMRRHDLKWVFKRIKSTKNIQKMVSSFLYQIQYQCLFHITPSNHKNQPIYNVIVPPLIQFHALKYIFLT